MRKRLKLFPLLGLLTALFLLPSMGAKAEGFNSSGGQLPIGAGGKNVIRVQNTGVIEFLDPNTGSVTSWIDTSTGKSSFSDISLGVLTTYLSGTATGIQAVAPVSVASGSLTVDTGGGANAVDLIAKNRIQSGNQTTGGGGMMVGPSLFIGSRDANAFGFWNAGAWTLIVQNGNVGIGKDPSHQLDVNGNLNALTLTVSGGAQPLTAARLNSAKSLEATGLCADGEAIQKTGVGTFACVNLVGATATTGLPFNGVLRYKPATKEVEYFDQATGTWKKP